MKVYRTKDQVVIQLNKDEYLKEMKLNKSLKAKNKSLKAEISNLENQKIELLKQLKDKIETNIKNIKELKYLQNETLKIIHNK